MGRSSEDSTARSPLSRCGREILQWVHNDPCERHGREMQEGWRSYMPNGLLGATFWDIKLWECSGKQGERPICVKNRYAEKV